MKMNQKLILTGLLFSASVLMVNQKGMAAQAPAKESPAIVQNAPDLLRNPLAKSGTKAVLPPELDPSTGWKVIEYSSDMNVPVEKIYRQDGTRPETGIKYMSTNFFNIGNSHFKAQRVIKLKKGKTYNMEFLYGIAPTNNKLGYKAVGFIDFNGVRFDSKYGVNVVDAVYKTTVVADRDQDYVITIQFDAPRDTGMFTMVAYDSASSGGGIIEESSVKAPIVTTPEANTRTVEGRGELSGNTIKVFDATNREIGSGFVDRFNEFKITTNRPLIHNEKLKVYQYNTSGDQSDATETTVKDTIAPDMPLVDNIEYNQGIVRGTTEAEATVVISKAGVELARVQADRAGSFSHKLTNTMVVGDEYEVYAMDAAGNKSAVAKPRVVDTIAPNKAVLEEITNLDSILKGQADEPNLKVTVTIGSQTFYGTTKADGSFDVNLGKPYAAGTIIKVVLTDASNNVSDPAEIKVISRQVTDAPTVNSVGDGDLVVTGRAEANSAVVITINGDVYTGNAGADGQFSIGLNQKYAEGTTGTATATGISGLISPETEFTVFDNTAPDKPVINPVRSNEDVITGTAEANSTVTLTLTTPNGVKKRFTGTTDANGVYSIALDTTYPKGSVVEVFVKDAAENQSETATITIEEAELTIENISAESDSQSKKFSFQTSRPNSAVTVEVGSDIYEGVTDASGVVHFELRQMYPIGTTVYYSATENGDSSNKEQFTIVGRTPEMSSIYAGSRNVTVTAENAGEVFLIVKTPTGDRVYSQTLSAAGSFTFVLDQPLRFLDTVETYQITNGYESNHSTMQIFSR